MSNKEYVEVLQKAFDYKPTANFILAGSKTLKQLRRQINEELIKIIGNKLYE